MEVDKNSKHKCKLCSKIFRCGRSLGGHMRSHLINISSTETKGKSDEAECKRKRPTSASEQEEVALTLILLSMDSQSQSQSHNTTQTQKSFKSSDQSEVNSPRRKSGPFFRSNEEKKKKKKPYLCSESKESCKFRCMICNKAFPSYQALGGHRASHKKFKGCCAPTKLPLQNLEECKKISKDHECPICFKIFPSGQALGGHKRSHLISDHAKNAAADDADDERRIPQVRHFLDLNLPAPLEEDCAELKPWWIGVGPTHEPLLGLLSTS